MKVLIVGESEALRATVRRMVGADAKVETLTPQDQDADLIVVEATQMTDRLQAKLQKQVRRAAILILAAGGPALRVQAVPENLSKLTYREVLERVGRHVVRDYLEGLLRVHEGNVTKAALAAGLERESIHRLLRRNGLHAALYRRDPAH